MIPTVASLASIVIWSVTPVNKAVIDSIAKLFPMPRPRKFLSIANRPQCHCPDAFQAAGNIMTQALDRGADGNNGGNAYNDAEQGKNRSHFMGPYGIYGNIESFPYGSICAQF
jgi:hypothetical protein